MICSKNTRKCHTYRDNGYNACSSYREQRHRSCRGWHRWFRWLCIGWHYFSSWVCASWYWIANIYCSAYVIVVEYYACGLINSVINVVCSFSESINKNFKNESFDIPTAWDTVRLSKLAYDGWQQTKDTLQSELSLIEDGQDIRDGVTDTECTICRSSDSVYIAFRGTESDAKDFVSDASLMPSSFYGSGLCGSKVHLGFVDAYRSVEKAIQNKLIHYMNTDNSFSKVIVTGHSLGGAIAVLCGYDLQVKLKDKKILVYTYGAPAVGNKDFVNLYNAAIPQSWKVTDPNDPVPMSTLFVYNHVKQIKIIDADLLEVNVKDHSIDRYQEKIEKLLPTKDTQTPVTEKPVEQIMIGNKSQKELHYPGCSYIKLIKEKNKFMITSNQAQAYYEQGYDGCYYCNHEKHWK